LERILDKPDNLDRVISVRRLMIFIDGGYLRSNIRKWFKSDLLNYESFIDLLITKLTPRLFHFEKIRVYYYDATSKKKPLSEIYISSIRKIDGFEDRIGTLRFSRAENREVQKGVDTLIAIDMLSKAFQDQYDVAFIIAGDRDFSPVIDYVKNTGKRIYGIFFPETLAIELEDKLDKKFELKEQWIIDERISRKFNPKFQKSSNNILNIEVIISIDAKIPLHVWCIKINDNGLVTNVIDCELRETQKTSAPNSEIKLENESKLFGSIYLGTEPDFSIILISAEDRQICVNNKFFFKFTRDYFYSQFDTLGYSKLA
jgi:uncharacterized LabA/DUF88 family protein